MFLLFGKLCDNWLWTWKNWPKLHEWCLLIVIIIYKIQKFLINDEWIDNKRLPKSISNGFSCVLLPTIVCVDVSNLQRAHLQIVVFVFRWFKWQPLLHFNSCQKTTIFWRLMTVFKMVWQIGEKNTVTIPRNLDAEWQPGPSTYYTKWSPGGGFWIGHHKDTEHLYHAFVYSLVTLFFPVSIHYLQCIHHLLHQTLEIFNRHNNQKLKVQPWWLGS